MHLYLLGAGWSVESGAAFRSKNIMWVVEKLAENHYFLYVYREPPFMLRKNALRAIGIYVLPLAGSSEVLGSILNFSLPPNFQI